MAGVDEQLGLRELKKRRTRQEIAAVAERLFAERGFEAVTVADVAREAGVAPKTVFNYFPAKEDLFFSQSEPFGRGLLDAVRGRRPGTSVIDAFRDFVLTPRGILALPEDSVDDAERVTTRLRVLLESPSLLTREKRVLEDYSRSLAQLIAEQTNAAPRDVEPRVVADALISVHRALIDYVRPLIVAGEPPAKLKRALRRQGLRAFARLEQGLGDYARL